MSSAKEPQTFKHDGVEAAVLLNGDRLPKMHEDDHQATFEGSLHGGCVTVSVMFNKGDVVLEWLDGSMALLERQTRPDSEGEQYYANSLPGISACVELVPVSHLDTTTEEERDDAE